MRTRNPKHVFILNHRINLIAREYIYDKASLVSISYLLSLVVVSGDESLDISSWAILAILSISKYSFHRNSLFLFFYCITNPIRIMNWTHLNC